MGNGQGIWTAFSCIREATLVAMRYRAKWDATSKLPLPAYVKAQVKPSGRALYVEAMSKAELGL